LQKSIRNIGIVAHVDAGKTTITEHFLYQAGVIRVLGSVDKGTSQTDWLEVEKIRGISVRAATSALEWRDTRVNLIDTPGHIDFSSEVERSLRVLDGAILVISAVEGVQGQTEVLWQALEALQIPTILFINKIDRIGSDTERVLYEIRQSLTPKAVPLQIVQGQGDRNASITGIMADAVHSIDAIQREKHWEDLIEAVSEQDEALLLQYLDGKNISAQQLQGSLVRQIHSCQLYPVLYGSAIEGTGMKELLDGVVDLLPSPAGEEDGPLSGIIFRLERDKTMGKVAYVRLYSGTLKNRDNVFNQTKNLDEKISQIRRVHIQKQVDTGILKAGDIAAVYGWNRAGIGDILGSSEGVPKEYKLAAPHLKVQVYPPADSDYVKLVGALQELADEDPLLQLEWLKNEREMHIRIMGTIQLEVLANLLSTRFGIQAAFGPPSVIYKETPTAAGEGFEAYTMPKPCWAIVRLLMEPGERGSGLAFRSIVGPNQMLPRYQNHVEKCLPDALKQGLYGWEVTDLKVTLIDGEHHIFHTHPLDFFVATPMAVMNGLVNTGTTLLEPMLDFRISAPEDAGGRIMGDLVHMRSEFDSPVISKGSFTVTGKVPVSTSMDFPVRLSSVTSGHGVLTTRFSGYQPCAIELGAASPRRGVNPLDRAKYILYARNALTGE
jgi:ribosomal protection tetracycline resistance protein